MTASIFFVSYHTSFKIVYKNENFEIRLLIYEHYRQQQRQRDRTSVWRLKFYDDDLSCGKRKKCHIHSDNQC